MLKEILLINSARFDFARVRLDKDLFFLGDNGSGKTSFIRAIHFLYSGDVKSLGISNDKESFKEYYFKYENSYIIYVFEHFFIFVYKRGNELHKVFSKQPFDLAKITDEAGKLKPFEAIRAYLRSAPLHKRVSGVSDYSDILYGLNRQDLDFKIADIRNKELFLRLFHAVFNVDKAIIDAKSIKRALMTSLQGGEESKHFDPEAYTQRINGFMEQYRFFNEIEKAGPRIEELERLHKRLLQSEAELGSLSAKIRWRKQAETAQLQELGEKIAQLEGQKEAEIQRLKSLRSFEERFKKLLDGRIDAVRQAIAEIEGDKSRFAPEKLQEARLKVREAAATEEENARLQRERAKLSAGIESAVESLELEIRALRRTIAEELPRRRRIEVEEAVRRAREEHDARLEAERLKLAEFERKTEEEIEGLQSRIVRTQEAIDAAHRRLEEARDKRQEALDALHERGRELRDRLDEALRQLRQKEEKYSGRIARLEDEANSVAERYEKRLAQHRAEYEKEQAELLAQQVQLRQVLEVEEGSFQAFLNDEVEGWQKSLYPLLDPALLPLPIQELKPRIVHRPVPGIELEVSKLKQMPTPEEAQERLERLASRLAALQERWQAKQTQLQQERDAESAQIESRIAEMRTRLEHLAKEQAQQKARYEEQSVKLAQERARTLEDFEKFERDIREEIQTLQGLITEIRAQIVSRREALKARQQRVRQMGQSLHRSLERIRSRAEAEVGEKEAQARAESEAQIARLEAQKATVQTDERLRGIEAQLAKVEARLRSIRDAQVLLEAYERALPKLRREPLLKERLGTLKSRRRRCLDRLDAKRRRASEQIERIKAQIEGAKHRLNRIEQGLQRLRELSLFGPEEAVEESAEELLEFIERLERGAVAYDRDRTSIGGVLLRLAGIKGLAKQDIHLDAAQAQSDTPWSELTSLHLQIDNLVELKRFRIDTLKREANATFSNFVKNLVTQQLTVFANTQEAFESLLAKVNTQLRQVDFGVIRDIRLRTRIEEGDSLARMFARLKSESDEIASLMVQDSLFFDRRDALKKLERLLELFNEIKRQLKSDRISLVDTIDLSLEFYENGVLKSGITQIKNESSTGGSMLLKIAIAIAILKVYIKNAENIFFLIVDEVARLHSENQKRLKNFANESGFRIIFVTPEPVFADPEALLYYKFVKSGEKFQAIALNR